MKDSRRFMKTIGHAAIVGVPAALLASPAAAEEPYELVWAKLIGTADGDSARGITLDAEGNVIICGVSSYGIAQGEFLAKVTQAGTLLWQKKGMWSNDAWDVAVDSAGNIYTAGAWGEQEEGFLQKYSASGAYLWSRSFSTSDPEGYAWCTNVAVDSEDNVYVSGFADGDMYGLPLGYGMFVAKYDSAGSRIWARRVVHCSQVGGMALDSAGNVLVAGGTAGEDAKNAVLAKFTASGERLWTREIITFAEWTLSGDIALDASDSIYFVGSVKPDLFSAQMSGLVMKLDANGERLWSRQYDPSPITDEFWRGVTVDAAGNAYVAGDSGPTLRYEGPAVMRLAKYDASGALLWLDTPDIGARSCSASGIVLDSVGNLFISGSTDELFGVPAAGTYDALVARYRPACYADCDGTGATDFFDFLCFQNLFAAGDERADCDGSEILDFLDFLCFQNAFAAGCPE